MQATDQTPGLREREKIRRRQTIRREAFRLIEENGCAATTVEQIAEAVVRRIGVTPALDLVDAAMPLT